MRLPPTSARSLDAFAETGSRQRVWPGLLSVRRTAIEVTVDVSQWWAREGGDVFEHRGTGVVRAVSFGSPTGTPLVIVPTYCEKDNVEVLTDRLASACPQADLLFVDDNSPDGTGRVIDELASRSARVHVLHRPGKAGLGRAYIAGFRWALERGYLFIVAMDADLSHDPRDVPRLLAEAERTDLVLGSRYLGTGRVASWGLRRELLSRAAGFYVRIITGMPFSDPTGGFKCYRLEVLESLDLGRIGSNGFAFQVEVTHQVWHAGFRVTDVPITFRDRRAGRSKISWAIAFEGAWKVWGLLARAHFRRRPADPRPTGTVQCGESAVRTDEDSSSA